ncbi:MAG: hypothetical protein ACTMKY_04155 [Dermabacteraceae bacterium]
METDRHASDGEDRLGRSGSTAHDASTAAAQDESAPADPTHADSDSRAYAYGEDPLETAGSGAEPGPADDPATGLHSATGLRGATAPRAVLRPVPEGFPTPPPRPARPNRRPAPRTEASAAPTRHRPLLLAGLAVTAVLLLIVVVGGGILAVRSFSSSGSPADPAPPAADEPGPQDAPDQTGLGSTEIGGVVVTEVSTEVGVRGVGDPSSRREPDGEYVIITFAVDNPTPTPIRIGDNVSLETADGTYPVDREATREHTADTSDYDLVPSEGSTTFHAVFDAPIGTDPIGLHLELDDLGENGTLPLSG